MKDQLGSDQVKVSLEVIEHYVIQFIASVDIFGTLQREHSTDSLSVSKSKTKPTKIDPFKMRPAGIKSNNEVGLRQDSIEYLDRNRTKTFDDKMRLFDFSRNDMHQSGKINE